KYPYDPFYGGISPRVGIAWNFMKDTVVRGGYARIFGRINGVNPLLVPLLTPGLLQPATCRGPNLSGGCGGNPNTIFRVGVDGTTAPLPPPSQNLPQPWYPGVNDVATGAGETVDPNFKPNRSDEFTLSIQHQFGPKILAEAGYIGRKISNEIEYYSLTTVPYMLTLNGQSFANAWKNVMVTTNYSTNVPVPKICTANCKTSNPTLVPNPAYYAYLNGLPLQPFFEAALGGSNSSYCNASVPGLTSCTAAFVASNANNANCNGLMLADDPFDLWATISNAGPLVFGRPLQRQPPTPPFFSSQKGIIGHILGGWNISPLFVYGSGFPVQLQTANGNCGSLGECNTAYVGANENMAGNFSYTATRHQNAFGTVCGTSGP